MITDSQLNLSWPVIGIALKAHLESTPTLSLNDPSTYLFKITNQLPSSSTTNPKSFSERYITVRTNYFSSTFNQWFQDEPITTQTVYLSTSALAAYLSLACAAYGSVWRTATITVPPPKSQLKSTATPAKDTVLFSYESNPAFFLQSGSIITSTSPGFSVPKSPTIGGQKMVKLTREEVNWVHDMLLSVWLGMVSCPNTKS